MKHFLPYAMIAWVVTHTYAVYSMENGQSSGIENRLMAAEDNEIIISTYQLHVLPAGGGRNMLIAAREATFTERNLCYLHEIVLENFERYTAIKNMADSVTYCDAAGNTALHLAAAFGYKDIVANLVARGADLMAKNNAHQKASDIAKLAHERARGYRKYVFQEILDSLGQ